MPELDAGRLFAFATADHTDTAIICLEPTAAQALAIEQADGEMADDLHVTLFYIGPIGNMDRNSVEAPLREFAKKWGPLRGGSIGGVGSFGPDGTDRLTIGLVQAPMLAEFRTDLAKTMAAAGIASDSTYDFVPHVTLAYGPIEDESAVVGLPMDFENIYLYWGGTVMSLPLTGDAVAASDIEPGDGEFDEGGGGETSDSASGPEGSDGASGPDSFAVTGAKGLPIAPRDRPWDASAAEKRVSALCQSGETFDPETFDWVRYGDAFMWRDKKAGHSKGGYKLPFADIVDGKMTAIPKGIFAAAGRLDSTTMPPEDKPGVRARIGGYYDRMRQQFNDPTIKAPWKADVESEETFDGYDDPNAADPTMPHGDYQIVERCQHCPDEEPFGVVDSQSNELMGCHPTADAAQAQVDALTPQENPVDETPTTDPTNAGEGDSSLATLSDDDLIEELARRAMANVTNRVESALSGEEPVEAAVEEEEVELADGQVGQPEGADPAGGNTNPDAPQEPNPDPQVGDGGLLGEVYDWQGVLTIEGSPSGDGRMIEPNCLTWRDLPLPLMLKTVTSPGHDGAEFAGWITEVERVPSASGFDIMGKGTFADTPAGQQFAEIISDPASQGRFGVSADIDSATAEFVDADTGEAVSAEDMLYGTGNVVEKLTSGRIMGATGTPFPAFQEAYIETISATDPEAMVLVASGAIAPTGDVWRVTIPARFALAGDSLPLVASGAVASALNEDLIAPPAEWFSLQQMDEPEPFTVHPDGRIYGLVAKFGTCHIGFKDRCVDVPRNADFRSFYGGRTLVTAEGTVVKVGSVIMDTVHPSLRFNASDAQAFYANTGSAVADVALHMNEWGIVAAGAVRPDADPIHVRNLRASDVSPDWRPIDRQLTLCALLAVNLSGFVVQSLVASGAEAPSLKPRALIDTTTGDVLALVAAGAVIKERTTSTLVSQALANADDRITALQAEVDQLKAFAREIRSERAAARLAAEPVKTPAQLSRLARRDAALAVFSGGTCAPLTPGSVIVEEAVEACSCGGTCGDC